ncbi:MAG TPA: hypothetical protein VHR55_05315 [Candidatus Limnocylindria bacterium]|nr:hypothetical protein [Candidatus Limnocylindria bacterium]
MTGSRRNPRVLPAADSNQPPDAEPTSRLRRRPLAAPEPSESPDATSHAASAASRARSRAEANDLYLAARDAWLAAMKAANSGRAADLAALAITQEAYEAATIELEQWESGDRVAIPIETNREASVDAVVVQELAWRKVHQHEHDRQPGLLGRLARRLRGR